MNHSASATTIDTTATVKRAADSSSYNYSSSSLLAFDVLACVVSAGVFGAFLGALLAFGYDDDNDGVGASLRIQSAVACGIHAVLPFAVWSACRERRDGRERPAVSLAIHLLLWTAGSLSAVYLGVFAAGLERGWFGGVGGETTTTVAVVSVASAALGLLSTVYQAWRFAIAGAVAAHRHPPASSSSSPSSGTDDDEEDDDGILSAAAASV